MTRFSAQGRRRLLLVGLFLLHALPFLARPTLIGGDEPHYALMAHSIGVDRDLDLEPDYLAVEAGSNAAGRRFAGRELDRHLVRYPRGDPEAALHFSHPLGLPALAAPGVALLEWVRPGAAPDLLLGLLGLVLTFAALLAGLRLLEAMGLPPGRARLIGLAIYFATPIWFYSRLFFTEAYAWSLAVLAIYGLVRRRWIVGSFLLGSVFLFKESYVLLILPVLAVVWCRLGFRRAALVALGPIACFGLWMAKNLAIYGEPIVTFQPFQMGDPLAGTLGLLFDPAHGLLVFAPVLTLALVAAAIRSLPRRGTTDLELASLVAFLAIFATSAAWTMWWGGSSYGPRLVVPAIPGLVVSLAVAWDWVQPKRSGPWIFVTLAALGFTVQWLAATDPFAAYWEAPVPDLVAERPLMALFGLALGLFGFARLAGQATTAARTAADC